MSRLHLIIGIISLAIMILAGYLTEMLKPIEAILFGGALLIGSPFMIKFVRQIRKHDTNDRSPLID